MLMDKIFGAFWQNTKRMDDKRIATLTPPSGVTEINNIAYLDDLTGVIDMLC